MAQNALNDTPRRDWFYWFMAAFTAVQLAWAGAGVADFAMHPWAPDSDNFGSPIFRLSVMLVGLPLMLGIALLVVRRAPGNVVGLFLLLWTASTVGSLLRPESPLLPFNAINTSWVGLWLLPLFFPDGQPYPPRLARWIRGLSAAWVVWSSFGAFVSPSQNSAGRADLPNAWYVPALGVWQPVFSLIDLAALGLVVVLVIPSLWLRYRASTVRARQQIKWVVWAFVLLVLALLPLSGLGLMSNRPSELSPDLQAANILVGLIIIFFPYLSIGISILRHRLYDIDVVIRRTLVYTALTGLLALTYFGLITVLQGLFRSISDQQSEISIVLSTLAIAALFGPVRNRVQAFIDRRFYRRKYDAAQTLAEFAAVARDETDLNALAGRLAEVVKETMAPEYVEVRLKTTAREKQP